MRDLKTAIRNALKGSSSQQPVSTATLYPLGTQKRVRAALMEMYQAHEVCCVMITHNSLLGGHVYWWLVGGVSAPHGYGKAKAKSAGGREAA